MNPSADAAHELAAWCAAFAERSPLPIAATTGSEHIVCYANEAFVAVMQVPVERIVGHPFAGNTSLTQMSGLSSLLDSVYDSGAGATATDLGGSTGEALAYATYVAWPIRMHDDRTTGLIVQMNVTTTEVEGRQDAAASTTELRDVNQQLVIAGLNADAAAERAGHEIDRLNALLQGLDEGVVLLDAAGRTLLVNRAAQSIWGLPDTTSATEIQFNRLRMADGTVLPFDRWPTTRARRGDRFVDEEYVLLRDDELHRLIFSGSAVRGAHGDIDLAIVTFYDVTRLRQLEQLREDHTALVSHDLRTPLAVVLGYAQRLRRQFAREQVIDQEKLEAAAEIEAAARRMNTLIQDLLDSNRLAVGALALNREAADLTAIIGTVAQSAPLVADRERISIEAPSEYVMLLDAFQMQRVISNLLGNALNYSPPGSPVLVHVRPGAGDVVVSITDQGRGIASDDIGQVFNRYYRIVTHEQGSQSGGYGLGLYISRLIVEAHGGRIWVESEVGKGSTFNLSLPLATTEDL